MKIVRKIFLLALLIYVSQLKAQTIKPDLQDTGRWMIVNRTVENSNEDGKKAIRFNEAVNDGYMILKDLDGVVGVCSWRADHIDNCICNHQYAGN